MISELRCSITISLAGLSCCGIGEESFFMIRFCIRYRMHGRCNKSGLIISRGGSQKNLRLAGRKHRAAKQIIMLPILFGT